MDFEKLGAFYLGREVDSETMSRAGAPLLYDSSDLTTHAVIVGMTGSGKTGLGIGLIEEAAIDGVPVLAIDPKGDLGNLALTFPALRPADFEPWLDPREAQKAGTDLSSYAADQAQRWREGLAAWGQGPERIERLRAAATVTVYTPGSSAGRPISVLRSFAAPPPSVLEDPDLLADRLATTATGLLTLLGQDSDPLGREHILLATILDHSWRAGQDLGIADLIHAVQSPPFDRVGVMGLETVFPAKDRLKLAMALNTLLASPSFEAWTQGSPLDIQELLYLPDGKPRVAVIAINHLSDAERMFFLSLLLSEVVAWTRAQTGTGSLRALVYIDELFGLLPPVAEPPTKKPLLTLLKQARAFGVGLALATQNPIDLDYKALSNAGSWFVGRLQTERDVLRLSEGLRAAGGEDAALSGAIARLPKRTFLLHNVHAAEPVIFQTRWAMSFLAGPLSRDQIRRLSRETGAAPATSPAAGAGGAGRLGACAAATHEAGGDAGDQVAASGGTGADTARPVVAAPLDSAAAGSRPFLPPHVQQAFFGAPPAGGQGAARYFPFVLAVADVHYSSKAHGVEQGARVARLVEPAEGAVPVEWTAGESVDLDPSVLESRPAPGVAFAPLPRGGFEERDVAAWGELFGRWLRTEGALKLLRSAEHKLTSRPGEEEREFRLRCAQAAREARDEQKEKLRARYGSKFGVLDRRILSEEQAVGREQQQLQHRAVDTVGSLVGALFGNRRSGAISSAIRKASSGSKDLGDVQRARERLAQAQRERAELAAELERESAALETASVHPEEIILESVSVKPSSRDVAVRFLGVAWVAHRQVDGRWRPLALLAER